MNLFKTSLPTQKVGLNPLIYPSPLGKIHFSLIINEKRIENFKPLETRCFQKTIVSTWEIESCHIELLQTHFEPKIPSSMKVDDCLAGIWRIKCFAEEVKPIFKVILSSNSSLELNGIVESGEGLVSISFENTDMYLSIGTEDEDYLNNRALENQGMPNHFFGKIFSSAIEILANGIAVSLPCLKVQDCIQIQFIVALSSKKHHKDSCWFSVEQSPEHILKRAGVV